MIKGHVTIDLHNHRSGFTERIEQDNLVTDAVGILASAYAGADKADKFMPIATKALGGLMLFDGTLEEDAANICFPGDVHLVGFTGQWMNTSNPLCGSLNVQETHATDTGYETVWDFSASQVNGTISALALTAAPEDDIKNNLFKGADYRETVHSLKYNVQKKRKVIAHSSEQLMYTADNFGFTNEYDSSRGIYTYRTSLNIEKAYVPIKKYKVADHIDRADDWEQLKQIEMETESTIRYEVVEPAYTRFMHSLNISNGYDGYAYVALSEGNDSGDGYFSYQKIKISDYSFDVEEPVRITVPDTRLLGSIGSAKVCKGKCFLAGKDRRYIYIVDLANTADIRAADLGEGWNCCICNVNTFYADPGGTERIIVSKKINEMEYILSDAIVYPDGEVVINEPYLKSTAVTIGRENISHEKGSLIACNMGGNCYPMNNYLGTICNLTSPIIKTAETSMKITYTLTDEVQS